MPIRAVSSATCAIRSFGLPNWLMVFIPLYVGSCLIASPNPSAQ